MKPLPFALVLAASLAAGCPSLCAQLTGPDAADNAAAFKSMSLEQLMNLDVTSVSREPQRYGDAPAAIDVVTGDQILRSGASSIPEALELADHLDVAQKTAHDWAISARGFHTELSNKLLVLMDGRTVYTPLFSGVFWDVQDYLLADLDRIEVISGPGGSLWGANAVNGVINITSKSARDTQGGYLEAGGGAQLQDFVGARYGVQVAPDVYLRVYGKYFAQGSEELANGQPANDDWRMRQGGFRMDSLAAPNSTLTLQGDLYSGTEHVTTGGVAATDGGNVLGRWTRTFSPDADFSLQLYYDRTHLEDPIPASAFAKAGILTDALDTYDLDFQDHFTLAGTNNILWGLGYRFIRDAVGNAPGLAFYPTRLDQKLLSAFLQDEVRLRPDLRLTVGSKIEHNDYTGGELEPSGRLAWTPVQNQTVWAAVSRAVRTPSRVDRDEDEPNPPPAVLAAQSTFNDETLVAYETGYRAQLSSQLSGSVSTFYNQYDHVRSLSFTPRTILPLYFANNLEGNTYGAETAASWQPFSWWQVHASYDLLRENIRVKPGASDLNNALNETADPVHQSSLSTSLNLPHGLTLDARLRWIDPLRINNGGAPATVPGYSELNARLAWQVTKAWELALVGQNLLHRQHFEYGVPGPADDEIQRNVYGEAAWHF